MTADEFKICMTILASTKLGSTQERELVALTVERAKLNTEEEREIGDEHVERYIFCANQALPYFSVSFSQIKFVEK